MHPGFGMVDVIGSRTTVNLSFAAYLALNDTMLSDGRIEALSDLIVDINADTLRASLTAHPFGTLPGIPVGLNFGA